MFVVLWDMTKCSRGKLTRAFQKNLLLSFIFRLEETLKMEAACTSKMLKPTCQNIECHIPENYILVFTVVRTTNLITRSNLTVISNYRRT